MKVRAAICWEPRQPLGECLVRLVATGVCHTDASTVSG
ncbi:MAG: S-(hydroxymethyl)glutathione dehydrogenase, partial [Deltaproteobacteria bacterium]